MSLTKKSTKTSKHKDDRYRALIEINLDPLLIIDSSGEITDANEAAVNITGALRKDLIHSPLHTYFTQPEKVKEFLSAIADHNLPANQHLTLKNGDERQVIFNGTVYQENNGTVLETLVVLCDVSPQKNADEQTSHLAAIVMSSNDAIISKSLDGIIRVWNKSAEKIFGYKAEEVIGKNISIIIPEADLKEEKDIIEQVKKGIFIDQYESIRRTKSGKLINLSISISPIRDNSGNITGISKIAREITEQKRFEEELIEAKKNAERDKKLAEEAMEAKQRFLSNMSHEIRTPMNAIIGFTKVVLKSNLDEKQREYLNAIKVSGDALIVLINDILDLAKVEAGKMSFEEIPFKLHESISSMLHLFETKLMQKKVKLIKQYDPSIADVLIGDPVRLHQIILNLVSNAIKFTSQGQIVVMVKLKGETTDTETVEFLVEDTGIGIPEDKLDSIFNNFQQATSDTTRIYGGTGLGLAIVKQLVLSQGGSLHVKSKLNEGSTFSFTLTFKKTEQKLIKKVEQAIVLENVSGGESDQVKILVAEDVTLNQLLIKTLLSEFNFDCVIAPNGKIAVDALQKQHFDLILMDLQMPVMNGYEATKYIRETLKSNIPIIALTADVTTADVEKCKAFGMNDYLSKPIDDKLLYNKILNYIDKAPVKKNAVNARPRIAQIDKLRIINLDYIKEHTKGNEDMMKEMISIYLQETPALIATMKQSIDNMDWESLGQAAHSIIPTFSIVGINDEYAEMAKKIKEHAVKKDDAPLIATLLLKIEEICTLASRELQNELQNLNTLKTNEHPDY